MPLAQREAKTMRVQAAYPINQTKNASINRNVSFLGVAKFG